LGEPSASNDPLKNRRQRFRARLRSSFPFISGLLAAFLALILYNAVFPGTRQLTAEQVNTAIVNVLASATPRPAYSAQVYQVIQPSVVLIKTDFPGQNGDTEKGVGSGVIINDQGDILTSLHVVANATHLSITFADGTESGGFVLASQPELDIAVLRAFLGPEVLVPATLGNPGSMHVGDDAYVVGNPFGLYSSMSSGVISGFNRTFRPPNTDQMLEGLIQVDAAINPGNSGGPLLNRSGHVIGIVTGIINPTEESFFVGIGFAVPINMAAAGGAGLPPY
jgi:S1-C subfamily serine protease